MTAGFLQGIRAPAGSAQCSASACEPYRELIVLELERGRNAVGIYQDLVDGHVVLQAAIRKCPAMGCAKLRGAVSAEARVIIETKPGEEGQVDYGTGPMVRDPDSGKIPTHARLFVLTLGCSRRGSVRLLVFQIEFEGVGRAAREGLSPAGRFAADHAVLDNLREGVLSADASTIPV